MAETRIKLPAKLAGAVAFATFAQRWNIPPAELALMIAHAQRSKAAWERNDDAAEKRHAEAMEAVAGRCGLTVDWPGLWPMIGRPGQGEDTLPTME